MTYKLTIRKKQKYLHVNVSGKNSRKNVKQYLEEVFQKCKEMNFSRLLIEEVLDGPRLDTFNVFEIASEGSIQSRGFFQAIAYVDVNAEGELMDFAETVAVNRALPVKVFSNIVEAERWIAGL